MEPVAQFSVTRFIAPKSRAPASANTTTSPGFVSPSFPASVDATSVVAAVPSPRNR